MLRFAYTTIDSAGVQKSGRLEAPDQKQAVADLRRQGLFPLEVRPLPGPAAPDAPSGNHFHLPSAGSKPIVPGRQSRRRLPFARAASVKEVALFTRQLATLLRAGMPLLRGLEVLGRQERNQAFRAVIGGLAESIKSGVTLSEAMGRHPRVFDRLYLNMVRAGELGGALDVVLDRLARFQEKGQQLRRKVTSAMVYPAVLLAVALAVLCGLLVLVVPKFKQIFADLLKGAALPPLTRWVLAISEVVKGHFVLVALAALAAGVGLQLWRRTPRGAWLADTAVVKAPLLGELFLKDSVVRFSRTLGTLLASGVPILPALLITRDTCANRRVAGAIAGVHDQVKVGAAISASLEQTGVFPPMVSSLIAVGEQTGQLPEMLGKIADIYEDEVDTAVAGLSSLLEPLLIVFLAVVVGTIVIALFLPIIRIVQLLT